MYTKTMLKNLYDSKAVQKHCKKKKNPSFENTQIELNSRTIIDGGSGTGKTHVLTHYIVNSPGTFGRIVICSKGIAEPLYDMLKERLFGKIQFYSLDDLPTLTDLDKQKDDADQETLLVFDDIVNDASGKNKVKLADYFIAGRKLGYTQFFISQSYYSIPKIIRQNSNYLILLKLSGDKDLKLILSDYGLGVDRDELVSMYRLATKAKFQCFKINVDATDENKKFSRGFTDFFRIKDDDDEGSDKD